MKPFSICGVKGLGLDDARLMGLGPPYCPLAGQTAVSFLRLESVMSLILVVLLVLLLVGALPVYPYSRDWGWGPGGVVGVLLIILVILVLTERI